MHHSSKDIADQANQVTVTKIQQKIRTVTKPCTADTGVLYIEAIVLKVSF